MARSFRRSALVIGCFLAGCVADTNSVANKTSDVSLTETVVVSLATSQTSLANTDELDILFSITNHTGKSFTVLPWGSPLETILSADVFEVIYGGKVLPYVGRVVKRAAPVESDYIQIAAGEKITATVNLSYAYELDAIGVYQVQLRTDGGKYRMHGHLLPVTSQPLVVERL